MLKRPLNQIRFIESLEISETSKKYKIVNEGETSALIIKQVESDCSGCYSCTISNDYGEVTSKGLLHVLSKSIVNLIFHPCTFILKEILLL